MLVLAFFLHGNTIFSVLGRQLYLLPCEIFKNFRNYSIRITLFMHIYCSFAFRYRQLPTNKPLSIENNVYHPLSSYTNKKTIRETYRKIIKKTYGFSKYIRLIKKIVLTLKYLYENSLEISFLKTTPAKRIFATYD